jgi:large subunit ribosomal protein L2
MSLKSYKPVTPSLRELVQVDRKTLWKGGPEKTLTKGFAKTGGRNNRGRITTRHIGGGARSKYREVDFKRNKDDVFAVVERIEYDPNRTCFIALVKYEDGLLSYVIAPQKLEVGAKIVSGPNSDIKIGNCLPLSFIPIGTSIHNVEMKPGKGGQMARAAGAFVQLVGKLSGKAQLKMKSGEIRVVPLDCRGTIGSVSNPDHQNINLAKAGRSRWLGVRPTVRGVAMNPVDHPHGGGEGRTSGGRHPVTPWGKSTKGKKTRNNKSTQKYILKRKNK